MKSISGTQEIFINTQRILFFNVVLANRENNSRVRSMCILHVCHNREKTKNLKYNNEYKSYGGQGT